VTPQLVLASASPRRAHILRSLGLDFRLAVPEVDETLKPGEDGTVAAERLARHKAESVAGAFALPVVAADTMVLCDGAILGKPSSPESAADMLRRLSARVHHVVTGVCLVSGGVAHSGVEWTSVAFGPMSEAEIHWYVATGEPLDKAGAYHVDGLGALFVESVTGSPSNVAGFPVSLFRRLVRQAGLALWMAGE